AQVLMACRIVVSQTLVGAWELRVWNRLLWALPMAVPSGTKLTLTCWGLGQATPQEASRLRSSRGSRVGRQYRVMRNTFSTIMIIQTKPSLLFSSRNSSPESVGSLDPLRNPLSVAFTS